MTSPENELTQRKPHLLENEDEYHVLESKKLSMLSQIVHSFTKPCSSWARFGQTMASFFPWLQWIPKYSVKEQLFGDLIGGLMAGIINITQGIAYAILAGLPPVNGLYSTFLTTLIYPVLASWPHGTLGPFAIVELMSGAAAHRVMMKHHLPDGNLIGSVGNLTEIVDFPLDGEITPSTIISTLTFMNGFFCLLFGALHLQFLMVYFSDALVSGFITAVSIHVFIAQLDMLMGVRKPRNSGFGYLFVDIYNLFGLMGQINYTTVLISLFSLVFLIVGKFVIQKAIQKLFSLKKLIIPWELFLVILTTLLAYFLQLDKTHNLRVVGKIPTGFPVPSLPKFQLVPNLIWDSLAISITQIAFHLSVARIMSAQCKYYVDERQEMYAIGASLIFTGFFPVFPGTNGLGRPLILKECGSTTQIACIVSGLVVLLVLLFLGPLLYWLPLCVLSIILLVAIRGLLKGFWRLKYYWRLSKWDALIWSVTFVSAICTDVIGGLLIGILFQMFTVMTRIQWPQWTARFSKHKHCADICIFDFHSMLLFANADRFKFAARQALASWNASGLGRCQRTFIFNMSGVSEIDTMGLEVLRKVAEEIRQAACVIYFANLRAHLHLPLQKIGAVNDQTFIFDSIEDAVWEARQPTHHIPLITKTSNPFDLNYETVQSMNHISL